MIGRQKPVTHLVQVKTAPQKPQLDNGMRGINDELATYYRNPTMHKGTEAVEYAEVQAALHRIARFNEDGTLLPFGYAFALRSREQGKEKSLPTVGGFKQALQALGGFMVEAAEAGGYTTGNTLASPSRNLQVGVGTESSGRNSVFRTLTQPMTPADTFEQMADETLPAGVQLFNELHPRFEIPDTSVVAAINAARSADINPDLYPTVQ